jgi:hypothetical protein
MSADWARRINSASLFASGGTWKSFIADIQRNRHGVSGFGWPVENISIEWSGSFLDAVSYSDLLSGRKRLGSRLQTAFPQGY